MSHPSHPDQLMAQALGVCWHPPTAVFPPCQPLADWELELLRQCGDVHGSGEVCVRHSRHGGHHHAGDEGLGWES